jgi:hypothetical protein
MLKNLAILLSAAAPLALMVSLWLLAQISRRFGEVTRRPPRFRLFYFSVGLMVLPALVRLLAIGMTEARRADLGGNSLEALVHDLPLALGITLALVIAWRYWGWLIYASEGAPPSAPNRRSTANTDQKKKIS